MSDLFRSSILGLALAAGIGGAHASDLPSKKGAPPVPVVPAITWFDIAVNVKAQTDYNFRGISQTDRKPGIGGGAELQIYNNLFYAGVYGSSVDLATRPPAEIDFYGGIRPKFGDLAFDLGVMQYYYPSEKQLIDATGVFWTPKNTDYTEVYGKVSYTFAESLTLGANVFYAWDWLGTGASGTYASVTAKYSLPFLEGLSVSGEFGHYWLGTTNLAIWSTVPPTNLPDYNYWNAGVSYTWKNVTADVRYHDTDLSKNECFALTADPRGITSGSGRSKWCGATVVATLSFDITASSLGVFAPK
uniref:TorF family putative porin n=1 Tax=Bosea sp. NBC_00436 TaxID=2969620 RepID=A0A9E8CJQ9_9HYPH